MGKELDKAGLLPQLIKHGHRFTLAGDKRNAKPGECRLKVGQAFPLKGGVGRAPLGLTEDLRLVEKDGEDPRPPRPLGRRGQGGLVGHPQVTLEPDAEGWWLHGLGQMVNERREQADKDASTHHCRQWGSAPILLP